MVREVFTFNGQPTQALYTTLPHAIAAFINNYRINFNDRVEDTFIWKENVNDAYNVKSGYSWLLRNSATTNNTPNMVSWPWIWRLKIPEKFKLLVWLACHNIVATLSLLHHRNIANSAICSRCGNEEEMLLHCLRDCNHSKIIWLKIGFAEPEFFVESAAQNWIKNNATGTRSTIFLAGLWWTWRQRNQMCLNADPWSLVHIQFQIQNAVEAIENALHSEAIPTPDRMVRWNENNFNSFVLNVDGSCLGTPTRAGFGGIIRNYAGLFLKGFSGYITTSSDILFAELTAIHRGILLAIDLGIDEMVCYSDSMISIQLLIVHASTYAIHRGILLAIDLGIDEMVCYSDSMISIQLLTVHASTYHAYAVLIQDIRDLLSSRNFTVHHCLREGNQCADFLAKLGATSNEEFTTYDTSPSDLLPLINNDVIGVLYPRA